MNGTQLLCMQMCLLAFLSSYAKVSGEKLHKVHVLLVQEHDMLQQHVCHKCGYSTKHTLDTITGMSRNQEFASVRTLSIADIVKKRLQKVDLG